MADLDSNPYESSKMDASPVGNVLARRTPRSRAVSFFVYSVLSFCFIYFVGSGYYINKMYRDRPPGTNYMTVGDMGEEEFRTKHPIVLFLLPLVIGGARAVLPR